MGGTGPVKPRRLIAREPSRESLAVMVGRYTIAVKLKTVLRLRWRRDPPLTAARYGPADDPCEGAGVLFFLLHSLAVEEKYGQLRRASHRREGS